MKTGLRQNRKQFVLLVIVNGFVGGMIGLERSILPQLAEQEFGIRAKSAILSFIVVFGLTKAVSNYLAGAFADSVGRRNLLIYGWLFGLPVPFMLMLGSSWNWIIAANVLLGINQGLTWSSTVIMKIDLAGEKDRGFAMGLNESAGYVSVSLVALLSGYIAAHYGVRPYPFFIGIFLSVAGMALSLFLVKDTHHFTTAEFSDNKIRPLKNVFLGNTFFNRNLSSVTQAGMVNNLNDGMIWGLLPILLAARHYDLSAIGLIVSVYPAVWGLGQLLTGKLSDLVCKKTLLAFGMLLQGVAIVLFIFAGSMFQYIAISVFLGIGTAIVYPAFLAAIAENTHSAQRAESIGVFRLWRDAGYAFGAILSGILADAFGVPVAVAVIGFLTIFSSLIVRFRMSCISGGRNLKMEKFSAIS